MPIPIPTDEHELATTVAYAKLVQARAAGDELAAALAEDEVNRSLDRIREASSDRPKQQQRRR